MVADLLHQFSDMWPSGRRDFRSDGDESWKTYALTLRDLVVGGNTDLVPQGLEHENGQVRALVSRALGFINDPAMVPNLAAALSMDSWATVRLLAADSLGMIGTDGAREALAKALESEDQADVKLHIRIAMERVSGLESSALEDLKRIEKNFIDIADTGIPAPDFSLPGTDGSMTSLSMYQDKRPVALYFLYGDG